MTNLSPERERELRTIRPDWFDEQKNMRQNARACFEIVPELVVHDWAIQKTTLN